MKSLRLLIALLLFSLLGCSDERRIAPNQIGENDCSTPTTRDAGGEQADSPYRSGMMALLGSRFQSFEELKSVIRIEYFTKGSTSGDSGKVNSMVLVSDCSNGHEVINILKAGISQGEISKARDGDLADRIKVLLKSPYAVGKRAELSKVYNLARRRTDLFGEGDPAFFDLAKAAEQNINTDDLAFITARDSSEKGYINTFNHMTAQAFITSCFSEKLADFVGDTHERYYHPELITGKFSEKEIRDLDEGPVDNYVDVINNEWGQELGKALRKKYHITRETRWTPELLANYLNDIQSYYSWAFRIGFKPFQPEDELVIRFSRKMNMVLHGNFDMQLT